LALHIPRLVLHVGIHKTGTTTLQVALESLRDQLRSRGVALITIGQMKRLKHEPAWARMTADPTETPLFLDELRLLIGEELEAVAQSSGEPARQVLITNERMVGARMPSEVDLPVFRPLAVASISQVVEALQPEETHLVVYTRRQDHLMESSYLWEVQKGLFHSIREQFPFLGKPVFRYFEFIERLHGVPGIGSIRVRPFEMIRAGSLAYLDDFLSNVGLQGELDYSSFEEDPSANRSYSQVALDLALVANPHLTGQDRLSAFRWFLKSFFPVGEFPAASIFTDEERADLIRLYRDDNERVFYAWMPDLPFDAYSTPDGVAKLGNVLVSAPQA